MGVSARMELLIVIVNMALLSMGNAKEDIEILKDMLRETNLRLSISEYQLVQTQKDLATALSELSFMKSELSQTTRDFITTKTNFAQTQADLVTTRIDLMTTMKELETTKNDLIATKLDFLSTKNNLINQAKELEREVSILREPPYFHSCGYQYSTSIKSQTVTYTSLLYSSKGGQAEIEPGGLDIGTGILTSPWPGSYTVSWGLQAGVDAEANDNWVEIYLYKNGIRIDESRHKSHYNGDSGYIYDQGGRTMMVYLGMGDTLSLFCEDCSANVRYLTF